MFKRFSRYINPSTGPEITRSIDRQSMRNIHYISLAVMIFEMITLVVFLLTHLSGFGRNDVISAISVSYCLILCGLATALSLKMLQNEKLSHRSHLAFKIFFYVAFSVWAIFVDYRHYKVGDQMLTFYAANLAMVCFINFRPLLSSLVTGGTYLVFYLSLYSFDHAAKIQPLNFAVLALASIACSVIQYHYQLYVCTKEANLAKSNALLEEASRRDGLTGLQNRLALEADANAMDGRPLTAYMIDINYFKEINDQHGHAAGDQMLRVVSETIKNLFPGAKYYRYGGDEFLVLTHKPPQDNYASFTYEFTEEKYGIKALLSIGNAQGSPGNYQELFDLIAEADKALYIVKERTHSVEFGGHDRRKRK